ncbi:Conserved_hypothetical protein [Hexamita inflata]|uniref:Uncharacterized protein n=1 Tax=Hexamita inflata TaxID=28002 RepID=A0AA86UZI7_9EUKA|nr:Conserved hypothetical protein [Hexamita inflata]
MNIIPYNSSVFDVLQQYFPTIFDFACPFDSIHDQVAKSIFELEDALYQPVHAAVDLLLLPLHFIQPLAPTPILVFQIIECWRLSLISNSISYSQRFMQNLQQSCVSYPEHIREQVIAFCDHVQGQNVLLQSALNFVPESSLAELSQPLVPVLSTLPLQNAQFESDHSNRMLETENELNQKVQNEQQKQALEEEQMTYEDKFSKYMLKNTRQLKQKIQLEKERAKKERNGLKFEGDFSVCLTDIYRQQLKLRKEENEIAKQTTQIVEGALNAVQFKKDPKKK